MFFLSLFLSPSISLSFSFYLSIFLSLFRSRFTTLRRLSLLRENRSDSRLSVDFSEPDGKIDRGRHLFRSLAANVLTIWVKKNRILMLNW